MFESAPQPNSQENKLETLMLQMKNEVEARWRASQAANQTPNPYDLIDATIESRELDISERLKAKTALIAHMRQFVQ